MTPPYDIIAIVRGIIKQFKSELELLEYSPSTTSYYLSVADQFLDLVGVKDSYTRQDVLNFLQAMDHLTSTSKSTYKHSLARFFEFIECPWPLKKRELRLTNTLPSPKTTFSNSEVNKIFEIAKSDSFTYAIVRTLAATGIRRSELCKLDKSHFNPPHLTDPMVKGEGLRTMTLEDKTIKAIKAYLKDRKDNDEALFLNPKTKRRITPQYITNLIKTLTTKAKINRPKLGAHAFRRYLTTELVKQNVNPIIIQQYMGWKSPEMVNRYSHLAPTSMEKAILKAHPLFH